MLVMLNDFIYRNEYILIYIFIDNFYHYKLYNTMQTNLELPKTAEELFQAQYFGEVTKPEEENDLKNKCSAIELDSLFKSIGVFEKKDQKKIKEKKLHPLIIKAKESNKKLAFEAESALAFRNQFKSMSSYDIIQQDLLSMSTIKSKPVKKINVKVITEEERTKHARSTLSNDQTRFSRQLKQILSYDTQSNRADKSKTSSKRNQSTRQSYMPQVVDPFNSYKDTRRSDQQFDESFQKRKRKTQAKRKKIPKQNPYLYSRKVLAKIKEQKQVRQNQADFVIKEANKIKQDSKQQTKITDNLGGPPKQAIQNINININSKITLSQSESYQLLVAEILKDDSDEEPGTPVANRNLNEDFVYMKEVKEKSQELKQQQKTSNEQVKQQVKHNYQIDKIKKQTFKNDFVDIKDKFRDILQLNQFIKQKTNLHQQLQTAKKEATINSQQNNQTELNKNQILQQNICSNQSKQSKISTLQIRLNQQKKIDWKQKYEQRSQSRSPPRKSKIEQLKQKKKDKQYQDRKKSRVRFDQQERTYQTKNKSRKKYKYNRHPKTQKHHKHNNRYSNSTSSDSSRSSYSQSNSKDDWQKEIKKLTPYHKNDIKFKYRDRQVIKESNQDRINKEQNYNRKCGYEEQGRQRGIQRSKQKRNYHQYDKNRENNYRKNIQIDY